MQQRRRTGSGSLATQGWTRPPPHPSPKESTLCVLTTALSLTLFLISKFQKCLWVKTLSFLIHLLFTYMITGVINIQTVFQLLAFLISFFIRRNESTSWNIFVIPLWIVYGISQGTRSFFFNMNGSTFYTKACFPQTILLCAFCFLFLTFFSMFLVLYREHVLTFSIKTSRRPLVFITIMIKHNE